MPEQRGRQPAAATIHGLQPAHRHHSRVRKTAASPTPGPCVAHRFRLSGPGATRRSGRWAIPRRSAFRAASQLRCARVADVDGALNQLGAARRVCAHRCAPRLHRARRGVSSSTSKASALRSKRRRTTCADHRTRHAPRCRRSSRSRRGRRGGQPATVAAAVRSAPAVGMGGATGVPLATALGVVRPCSAPNAACSRPRMHRSRALLRHALAPLCTPVCRNRDDLVLITTIVGVSESCGRAGARGRAQFDRRTPSPARSPVDPHRAAPCSPAPAPMTDIRMPDPHHRLRRSPHRDGSRNPLASST